MRNSPANTDLLFEACKIGVRYHQRWLVADLDLSLAAGQIVTLVGSNGTGKTTLAKVILGVRSPDAGTVRRREGLRVGYLPQQLMISATLPITVGRVLTLTGRHRRAVVLSTLEAVGVAGFVDRPWSQLSGGERQRVLLARALLGRPGLLVLDEPLQGVDTDSLAPLYRLINRVREQTDCGILLITHDLHLIRADLITQSTDRVVCLNSTCSGEHPPLGAGARV